MYIWSCLLSRTLILVEKLAYGSPDQHVVATSHGSPIAFSSTWQLLGPFQIGTREASWGADPLEYLGGFRALEYDPSASYHSSLSVNATVNWSFLEASRCRSNGSIARVDLDVSFSDVDWTFLQAVYGWAALQWQAWARGDIFIASPSMQTVVLYTEHVLEFWLDEKPHYGGDFYAFRKAPLVLHLSPGHHRLDVRLIRDVRAMGGVGLPGIKVGLEAKSVSSPLDVAENGMLVPDIVDGRLASHLASLVVRNNDRLPIEVLDIACEDDHFHVSMLESDSLILAPGQTRTLPFSIVLRDSNTSAVQLRLTYHVGGEQEALHTLVVPGSVKKRSLYDPHKVTFLHPGGLVSYAIIRPPAQNASCGHRPGSSAPVLLQLHGAGLKADSDLVAHALDLLPDLCAWVLFPTGVTPWSGDDWHTWGFADVEAAINSISSWIEATKWQGIDVDLGRWLVSGHSNGGQGTWYALTHRPDNVIAAAPVSGYSSIQSYVPYQLWHPMDPNRAAVLHSSLNSYRHELLAENCQDIAILQQHGSADDNVPAYHSRLMSQLLFQAAANSTYEELTGKGHWFDGVMTTKQLASFYHEQLTQPARRSGTSLNFTMVVANPGDMGSKGGIKVAQLQTPGQYGTMTVSLEDNECVYSVNTSNILAFKLRSRNCMSGSLVVDGQSLRFHGEFHDQLHLEFWRMSNGVWEQRNGPLDIGRRRGPQLGTLNAILRSKGRFAINCHGAETSEVALQISRNLFQYFSADALILDHQARPTPRKGNVITVATGMQLPEGPLSSFPIRIESPTKVSVRGKDGRWRTFAHRDGLAAIYIRPLKDEALELVVWGTDVSNLALAARLVPTMTGVGQPDFVVLSRSCRWKGAEGAVAMGFFDYAWNVTDNSFFA